MIVDFLRVGRVRRRLSISRMLIAFLIGKLLLFGNLSVSVPGIYFARKKCLVMLRVSRGLARWKEPAGNDLCTTI